MPLPSLHTSLLVRVLPVAALLAGCGAPPGANAPSATGGPAAMAAAPPPDILLVGERHDAPGQIEPLAGMLQALIDGQRLGTLVLEMAPAGTTTVALPRDADAAAVQKALAWNGQAWAWTRYAPAVMRAVAAGVPVVGGNLPRAQMATAMADVSLDAQLDETQRARLTDALRTGHCGLLPESRLPALLRVQVARDRSMAHVLAESVVPGRTAVLLAGSAHVDGALGVPLHLPTPLRLRSIALVAEGDALAGRFDERMATPAAPVVDACAVLRRAPGTAPAR